MEHAALALEAVDFRVSPTFALKNIDFKIQRGQVCVLLGANGAGKSTLMSLCCGMIRPRTGRISLSGLDLFDKGHIARRELGAVFQNSTLDLDLSVLQNLRYQALLQGLNKQTAMARIQSGIERYSLEPFIHQRCGALSGGERRRVELIRALLHQPSLLLMDEATAGIDISQRLIFAQQVRKLCAEQGVAALWTTHMGDEVHIDDPVLVIHKGQIVAQGIAKTLMEQHGIDDIQALYPALIEAAQQGSQ